MTGPWAVVGIGAALLLAYALLEVAVAVSARRRWRRAGWRRCRLMRVGQTVRRVEP